MIYLISVWSTFHVKWGKQWPDMTSYGLDKWFWEMFDPTPTWPNFEFGQLLMRSGAKNDKIWFPRDQKSDFEKCSNWLKLDLFGQLCMWIGENNNHIWLPRGFEEWFSEMFESTQTWPDFTFAQLVRKIGSNNSQIWLSMGYILPNNGQILLPRGEMSDFVQCLNWFQFDLI